MKNNLSLVSIILTTLNSLGCSINSDDSVQTVKMVETKKEINPIYVKGVMYQTPEMKFAHWMINNEVNVYTSPGWCQPCKNFADQITPLGVAILKNEGKYLICNETYYDPWDEVCEDVSYIPTFTKPGSELFTGFVSLQILGEELGYPQSNTLPSNFYF